MYKQTADEKPPTNKLVLTVDAWNYVSYMFLNEKGIWCDEYGYPIRDEEIPVKWKPLTAAQEMQDW